MIKRIKNNVEACIKYLKEEQIDEHELNGLIQLFGNAIENYCELIFDANRKSFGIMFRGESNAFTNKVVRWMNDWDVPEEAKRHYLDLSNFFHNKNAFIKLEWHRVEGISCQKKLISCYFRRRPSINEMTAFYTSIGVEQHVLKMLVSTAQLFEKQTIHFIAASYNQEKGLSYKWYFSQYLSPEKYSIVENKLRIVFEHFGISLSDTDIFFKYYLQKVFFGYQSSIFISLTFTKQEILPTFKIDMPDIAISELPSTLSKSTLNRLRTLMNGIRTNTLSYAGWRFSENKNIQMKFYLDLHPAMF